MLIAVEDFCRRVREDMPALVTDLQDLTGREGESEKYAWESSLPRLADALGAPALAKLHLHFQRRGRMELEYRLPSAGSWCDAVLLGQGPRGPAAVVIELKHWLTGEDRPGPTETLIYHAGGLETHPCDQVGAYVEYCRRFHSAVQEENAEIDGCVLFTRTTQVSAYLQPPHDGLAKRFPVFAAGASDLTERFPAWIAGRLHEPNEQFAEKFSEGVYKQDRRFVRHVSSLLRDPKSSPFVLLDQQRRAFDLIMLRLEEYLTANKPSQRIVFIVEGPPGSGKSVLAAQLWARLANHPAVEGNVVMTTTSGCQRSNWEHLFRTVANGTAGAGLVVPANSFNPGLRPQWVKEARDAGHPMKIPEWRTNLKVFKESGQRSRCPDLHFAATIVDEGHALIDPTAPNSEGIAPSGWSLHAGPQAWHLIRASKVSIFLLDGEQSYRDNETTTPASIARFAESFPDAAVVNISLHGAQFRCGGSKEYTDWVEDLLETSEPDHVTMEWRKTPTNLAGRFEFEVVDNPRALEEALRARADAGASVRLVSSYAREWKTQPVAAPHDLPDREKDFYFEFNHRGRPTQWAKIWNFAPELDYTYFIQGREGTPIGNDPLCEVGCPYVVRGFDFDYVGLLWLPDLVRRGDRWVGDLEHVHESAWNKSRAAAKKDKNGGPGADRLLRQLKRGYRILLTRAIKGVYVWCADDETRAFIAASLRK